MHYSTKLESEIISKVKRLNRNQKNEVLDYLETIPKMSHSTRLYRRKALKQIREALDNQ
ncbi:hypothetical protein C7460_12261 [Marinoscillum furvescens DSM 4134]|uniref:Uncharacterized protein n=1 Tax=Marinoscillum furvescens DSM 4134 TaxID=1122208 RepID=A0A3D9KZY6_MARFU|nr:hypothetical protein C7460_12261 [Marinoscillum furvescens DSM 4134]